MCAANGDPVTLAAAIAMYEGQEDAVEAVTEAKLELSRLEKVASVHWHSCWSYFIIIQHGTITYLQAAVDPRPVIIRGSDKIVIDGVFLRTGGTYNGKPAYRKEDNADMWLIYGEDSTWMVADTEDKDDNGSLGFCISLEKGLLLPSFAKAWNIDVGRSTYDWQRKPGRSVISLVGFLCPYP